jgi:hypothetical protein
MAPSFERPYAPGLACWFGWWVLRKVVGLCGQAILLGARRDVRRANPGWRRASVIGKGDYDDGQYRQSSTEQKNDRNAIKQIFKKLPSTWREVKKEGCYTPRLDAPTQGDRAAMKRAARRHRVR